MGSGLTSLLPGSSMLRQPTLGRSSGVAGVHHTGPPQELSPARLQGFVQHVWLHPSGVIVQNDVLKWPADNWPC